MTKEPISPELKQNFARGNLKPSQLKRSRSTGDILPNLPPPALQKSKSSEDISPEPSELKQQITSLQDELTLERKRVSSLREDLAAQQEKLKAKEQAINGLKNQISQLQDQILELRLKNLQDFGEYYEEKQALQGELAENISQGIKEIERLEKQLLALNRKKLTMQAQLKQSELKNTQLELKALDQEKETPPAFNFS
jgi:chromosome segregation ATPase